MSAVMLCVPQNVLHSIELPQYRLQLYEELLSGLHETQLALAEYTVSIDSANPSSQPANGCPAMQQLCRSPF